MIDSALKNKFEFILVEPSHPGNIGATARAIKNMGFQNLSLINPKGFPNDEAFFRAKGAKDILENVKIYNDLVKPLKDATLIFGTSARTRTIPWPTRTSSELHSILKKALTNNIIGKLSGLLNYMNLKKFKKRLDPRLYNGAIFIGLDSPVIKSHGSTDFIGFSNSLTVCEKIVRGDLITKIKKKIS